MIVGDTHGQLEDVLWIFFKYGEPSEKNVYVFNGDITDRSGHALEILVMLAALKLQYPSSIYITRGNHEDEGMNERFGLSLEPLASGTESEWTIPKAGVFIAALPAKINAKKDPQFLHRTPGLHKILQKSLRSPTGHLVVIRDRKMTARKRRFSF